MGLTYRHAGVDIAAGDRFVDIIRKRLKGSESENIGPFGGFFDLAPLGYKNPVLVASTDGVGTKLLLAKKAARYDTIGIDLVAMCVNDIITSGAKPLFFLDYLATSKLKIEEATVVLDGVIEGCREAGCTLLGGETAEMPGMYEAGVYELAGFAVGMVEREKIIDGTRVQAGDVLVGLPSNGIHANGLSLARSALFDEKKYSIDAVIAPLTRPLIDELLMPTRIYVKTVMDVLEKFKVRGIAHITGGGLYSNTKRSVPGNCDLRIEWRNIPAHPVFSVIQEAGRVEDEEMHKTFNMGIGLVLIVDAESAEELCMFLMERDEKPVVFGEVVAAVNDEAAP